MNLDLRLQEIEDVYSRENFFRIKKYLDKKPFLRGEWAFFELQFENAVTNQKVKHGLGYLPKDVIQTSSVGAGVLTWNYGAFDREFLDVTTTGPVTVRAFIGRFEKSSDF